ncbi:MAG: hypothetical protein R2726_03585 [Acidimicrobiales bacterium]
MALPSRSLRAMVCASDLVDRRAMAVALSAAGFEVIEEVDNAARAIQLAPFVKPAAIVLGNELTGMLGSEAVAPLREIPTEAGLPPEIVLVSADRGVVDEALAAGALVVVPRDDAEELADGIDALRHLLETGERRSGGDRRSGADRRKTQDWAKVTRQRRSGQERRSGIDRRQLQRRADEEAGGTGGTGDEAGAAT